MYSFDDLRPSDLNTTLAYWLGTLNRSLPVEFSTARQLASAMSFHYDVEEQATSVERLRTTSKLLNVFQPIAPVTLCDRWSPIPLLVSLLENPVLHGIAIEDRDNLASFAVFNPIWLGSVDFPISIHERHAVFLAKLVAARALETKSRILVIARPGWSYESQMERGSMRDYALDARLSVSGNSLVSALHWWVKHYLWGMPETASFTLKYDGPALAEHTIDVNDLAPALLALGDLLQEANKIAHPGNPEISLKVRAREPGCFQVDVILIQTMLGQARDFLAGSNVTAIANLITLLGIPSLTTGGLIWLVKFLKGQKPKEMANVSPTQVQITNNNNQTVIIEKPVLNIYLSPIVRKALYQIVKPAEKEGIDDVEFVIEGGGSAKIEKADIPFFNPLTQEEEIQESEREVYVNVENAWLSGRENRKWRFREGNEGAAWNAEIVDQAFIENLIKGEVSLSGADTLKVLVKQVQYSTASGIKSDYEITKVLEHIKGHVQVPLALPAAPPTAPDKP